MPISIKEIANQTGFRGPISHRRAEPMDVRTLPVIDNADSFNKSVRTSVDCYVSGQYVQRNGRVLEVTQRYTVYVSYTKESQYGTMQQVRDRIARDFQEKYGNNFNISNIYVPTLPVPVGGIEKEPGEEQMYGGSRMFRDMTKFEKARYDIGTERLKAGINIESIKKRYGLKR